MGLRSPEGIVVDVTSRDSTVRFASTLPDLIPSRLREKGPNDKSRSANNIPKTNDKSVFCSIMCKRSGEDEDRMRPDLTRTGSRRLRAVSSRRRARESTTNAAHYS